MLKETVERQTSKLKRKAQLLRSSRRFWELKEHTENANPWIEALPEKFGRMHIEIGDLSLKIERARSESATRNQWSEELKQLKSEIEGVKSESAITHQLSEEVKSEIRSVKSRLTHCKQLFAAVSTLNNDIEGVRKNIDLLSTQLARNFSNVLILVPELSGKHILSLWRGSGDGFRTVDCHSRCDGHPNTLTMILDANGNRLSGIIFKGQIPAVGELM